MADPEVFVKGELHTSRGDHLHERDILVKGVDTLVLEGSREKADYTLLQAWYAFALLLTELVFFRQFYTDSSVLEDIAKAKGAQVVKTRDSDASILENSHILARVVAGVLFLALLFVAILFARAEIHGAGALTLILGVMLPLLLLRMHESNRSTGSRDEQMADAITEAAENGGSVVAIVGEKHAEPVCDHLPEWIDPIRENPVYSWYSVKHVKDIAYPLLASVSILWVVYTGFVLYIEFAWRLT